MIGEIFNSDLYLNGGPVTKTLFEYCTGFLHKMKLSSAAYSMLLDVPAIETGAFLQGKRDGEFYYKVIEDSMDMFPEYSEESNRYFFAMYIGSVWIARPWFTPTEEETSYLKEVLNQSIIRNLNLESKEPVSNKSIMEIDSTQIDTLLKKLLEDGKKDA